MNDDIICVVGLGEIGFEVLKKITEHHYNIKVFGVDIDKTRVKKAKKEKLQAYNKLKKADVYIVCAYTTEQVINIVKKIDKKNNPLISIDATVKPGTYNYLKSLYPNLDIVLFPHRFNPNDKEHHIFNLNRVMGGNASELRRARKVFKCLFVNGEIFETTPKIAELCKPLENTIRYLEIALAEEIKMECDKYDIDFEELREAVNTKWNINLKEARDGIGGKCLPKDSEIIRKFFYDNKFFKLAKEVNDDYLRYNRS